MLRSTRRYPLLILSVFLSLHSFAEKQQANNLQNEVNLIRRQNAQLFIGKLFWKDVSSVEQELYFKSDLGPEFAIDSETFEEPESKVDAGSSRTKPQNPDLFVGHLFWKDVSPVEQELYFKTVSGTEFEFKKVLGRQIRILGKINGSQMLIRGYEDLQGIQERKLAEDQRQREKQARLKAEEQRQVAEREKTRLENERRQRAIEEEWLNNKSWRCSATCKYRENTTYDVYGYNNNGSGYPGKVGTRTETKNRSQSVTGYCKGRNSDKAENQLRTACSKYCEHDLHRTTFTGCMVVDINCVNLPSFD